MEEIRNGMKSEKIEGYTPYWGISSEKLENGKWEVVCFLYPYCDGTCAHCWSSQTYLGRVMPLEWHENFWRQVDRSKIKEVRLTGGEPFLYKEIGRVVKVIRQSVGSEIPIGIFTSGRNIISLESGRNGISETVHNILRTGVVLDNVEIYLSADEHHAGSLYRASRGIKSRPVSGKDIEDMNKLGIPLLQTRVINFLAACDILVARNRGFGGGKIKVHVETNRLKHHRNKIFSWLDETDWDDKVISSEGLIRTGSAKNLDSAINLLPSSQLSLFVFPGAEFYQRPQTNKAQAYYNTENRSKVYLDEAGTEVQGASIIGWWNIVNRVFCGGSAYDTYQLIG